MPNRPEEDVPEEPLSTSHFDQQEGGSVSSSRTQAIGDILAAPNLLTEQEQFRSQMHELTLIVQEMREVGIPILSVEPFSSELSPENFQSVEALRVKLKEIKSEAQSLAEKIDAAVASGLKHELDRFNTIPGNDIIAVLARLHETMAYLAEYQKSMKRYRSLSQPIPTFFTNTGLGFMSSMGE